MNEKTLQIDIEEAKRDRIIAEAEKFKAEAKRAELEAHNIEQTLGLPLFRRPFFLQAITAGIIAVPLIWFYLTNVAIPLYKSENIALGLKNEQTKKDLEYSKQELEQRILKHRKKRIELEAESKNLQKKIDLQTTTHLLNLENLRQVNLRQKDSYEKSIAYFRNQGQVIGGYNFFEIEKKMILSNLKINKTVDEELRDQISVIAKDSEQQIKLAKTIYPLLFNGLYQRETKKGYSCYLRFFMDGTIVASSSTGRPEEVYEWLDYSRKRRGKYKKDNNLLNFEVTSERGTSKYSGFVRDSLLVLDSHSMINDHKSFGELYKFVRINIPIK